MKTLLIVAVCGIVVLVAAGVVNWRDVVDSQGEEVRAPEDPLARLELLPMPEDGSIDAMTYRNAERIVELARDFVQTRTTVTEPLQLELATLRQRIKSSPRERR